MRLLNLLNLVLVASLDQLELALVLLELEVLLALDEFRVKLDSSSGERLIQVDPLLRLQQIVVVPSARFRLLVHEVLHVYALDALVESLAGLLLDLDLHLREVLDIPGLRGVVREKGVLFRVAAREAPIYRRILHGFFVGLQEARHLVLTSLTRVEVLASSRLVLHDSVIEGSERLLVVVREEAHGRLSFLQIECS